MLARRANRRSLGFCSYTCHVPFCLILSRHRRVFMTLRCLTRARSSSLSLVVCGNVLAAHFRQCLQGSKGTCYSVPSFVLALPLQNLFAIVFIISPVKGMLCFDGSTLIAFTFLLTIALYFLVSALQTLLLPLFANFLVVSVIVGQSPGTFMLLLFFGKAVSVGFGLFTDELGISFVISLLTLVFSTRVPWYE